MKKCPNCNQEYPDLADTCPECNIDLDMGKQYKQGVPESTLKMVKKSNFAYYATYVAMLIAIVGFPILSFISFRSGRVANGLFCILFIYLFPKAVLGSLLYWAKFVLRGNTSPILYILFGSTIRKYSRLPMPVNPIFDWFLLIISFILVANALNL